MSRVRQRLCARVVISVSPGARAARHASSHRMSASANSACDVADSGRKEFRGRVRRPPEDDRLAPQAGLEHAVGIDRDIDRNPRLDLGKRRPVGQIGARRAQPSRRNLRQPTARGARPARRPAHHRHARAPVPRPNDSAAPRAAVRRGTAPPPARPAHHSRSPKARSQTRACRRDRSIGQTRRRGPGHPRSARHGSSRPAPRAAPRPSGRHWSRSRPRSERSGRGPGGSRRI